MYFPFSPLLSIQQKIILKSYLTIWYNTYSRKILYFIYAIRRYLVCNIIIDDVHIILFIWIFHIFKLSYLNVFFAYQVLIHRYVWKYRFCLSSSSAVCFTRRVYILMPSYTRDRIFQVFAALSVLTACAMAIPIFVEGGPRSQSSESAENYVSILKLIKLFLLLFESRSCPLINT